MNQLTPCAPSYSGFVSSRWIFAAIAAWAAVLIVAVLVRDTLQLTWSDLLPAAILGIAPVVAALVFKLGGHSSWSLVVAGAILGASTFIPSILVKDWARELFDVGGSAGFIIALLGAWRVRGGARCRIGCRSGAGYDNGVGSVVWSGL